MRHLTVFTVAMLALSFVLPAQAELKPIKRVEPVYPRDAARYGTSGFVEVEFTVDATGKVVTVSVVNAKPTRTFESAAVQAVKQWMFAPGEDGSRGKVRLEFKQ